MLKFKRLSIVFIVLGSSIFIPEGRNQAINMAAASSNSQRSDDGIAKAPDIAKKYLLGQFKPASEKSFVKAHTPYAKRDGLYLLSDVYDAFIRMHKVAKADGISLIIVSATRTFDDQKKIWHSKWTGKRLVDGKNLAETVSAPVERAKIILKYSSMPGTSRHHWGTDIDINSVSNAYFESGIGLETYKWLVTHAVQFGFVQPYTPKGINRPHGYNEEPWHWSYNPIAKYYTQQYLEKVSYDDLTGFKGSETAPKVEVISNYVLGINRDCFK